jgi:hypothetical protein
MLNEINCPYVALSCPFLLSCFFTSEVKKSLEYYIIIIQCLKLRTGTLF